MLEPNVRDYQGVRNSVNSQIRESLASPEDEDFWWLNNGITVLSTNCSVSGNKLQLTAPEIVNGLQTSSEIYGVFSAGGEKAGGATADTRSVLVRVIVSSSDISRDKVIKATNNQTPVEPLSLRATDRLHFDIEDRLNLFSVFYDRKKGKYKRLQKPIADIVGMKTVSQAVMAIALRRPEDARGRPGTILKDEASYDLVFNEAYPRDLYVVCVLIDRQVDQFLAGTHKNLRRDIRYCSDTLVACLLAGSPEPTVDQLAALVPKVRRVSEAFISEACNAVYAVYVSLGDTDKVAKSRDLWANVVKDFAALKARIA